MGEGAEKRGIGNFEPVTDGGASRAVVEVLVAPVTMPDGRIVTGYTYIPRNQEVPIAPDPHPGAIGGTGGKTPGDFDLGI